MSDKKKKARAGRPRTAAAIIIGNEILSGKIADQNLVVLARVLRKLGVQLVRTVVIPDVLETIVEEVRAAAKAHTWVFTSGGVGPTHDDLTIVGVAKAFKKKVETSAELEAKIRAAYGDRLREGHLFMARVPKGAKLVQTEEVPWPAVVMKNVWVLPGVPEVFAHKMVLLEQLIEPAEAFESVAVFSTLDEGNLKPYLDRVVAEHPSVDVGSYPRWTDPHVRTKLTFDARDKAACEAAARAFAESLPAEAIVASPGPTPTAT
ncbi:MAG: competence/damage-inducible protein A [Polyangiaceae bacterium]|jgi:molybdenum cofactor synthesis domain-containing protein|nr:competence/damage-inducible protein A [Polyangiaceae bacterium]MBK8939748.1 competence/damage-inducible protein A [Polyangiaceae bacterium]